MKSNTVAVTTQQHVRELIPPAVPTDIVGHVSDYLKFGLRPCGLRKIFHVKGTSIMNAYVNGNIIAYTLHGRRYSDITVVRMNDGHILEQGDYSCYIKPIVLIGVKGMFILEGREDIESVRYITEAGEHYTIRKKRHYTIDTLRNMPGNKYVIAQTLDKCLVIIVEVDDYYIGDRSIKFCTWVVNNVSMCLADICLPNVIFVSNSNDKAILKVWRWMVDPIPLPYDDATDRHLLLTLNDNHTTQKALQLVCNSNNFILPCSNGLIYMRQIRSNRSYTYYRNNHDGSHTKIEINDSFVNLPMVDQYIGDSDYGQCLLVDNDICVWTYTY